MKKKHRKKPTPDNGILSKINDASDKGVKIVPADREKGVISTLNDDPEQKK